MYALDFEYDGLYLSDYGFVICNFDGASDMDVISAGSKITFNTVSKNRGKKNSLTSTQYDECIQTTFQICKNPELYDDLRISRDEYRDIMRWLNRDEFLKFQIINEEDSEYETCYYEASFNIDKIVVNKVLYGMELTMETNKPFGYGVERNISWMIEDTNKTYILNDMSDVIGYTYPSMIITCNSDGDLSIHNDMENCTMTIKSCKAGEIITIDGDILNIESSVRNSQKICNAFNYDFFKIGNTINNRRNQITVSLPCKLELKYSPTIKDTPD